MYIIETAYDDNTAVILDLGTYEKRFMLEKDLIYFGNKHDVLGLSVSNNKINYITSYSCISFSNESEADEYIRDASLTYKNKRNLLGYTWVFEKKDHKIHVDYYICAYAGPEVIYVGKEGGYTPYIQAAKTYSKQEAGKTAALMRQHSKTGKHWKVQRTARG